MNLNDWFGEKECLTPSISINDTDLYRSDMNREYLAKTKNDCIHEVVMEALNQKPMFLTDIGKKLLGMEYGLMPDQAYVTRNLDGNMGAFRLSPRIASQSSRTLIFELVIGLQNVGVMEFLRTVLGDGFCYEAEMIFLQKMLEIIKEEDKGPNYEEITINYILHNSTDREEYFNRFYYPENGERDTSIQSRNYKLSAMSLHLPSGYIVSHVTSPTTAHMMTMYNCCDTRIEIDMPRPVFWASSGESLAIRKAESWMEYALLRHPDGPFVGMTISKEIRDMVLSPTRITKDEIMLIKMAGLERAIFIDKQFDLRDTGFRLLNF